LNRINGRRSSEDFLETLVISLSKIDFSDSFFEEAFALHLPRARIGKWFAKVLPKLEHEHDPFSITGVYYRSKNLQTSEIIEEDEFELLWSWLAPGLRIKDPKLEFTSSNHGTSVKNLLYMIDSIEKTIFIIRAVDGKVFGLFANAAWNKHTGRYFGDRQCFVWTMRPHPEKYGWAPTHENDKMQLTLPVRSFMSMGCGPPAIELHDGLNVSSYVCPTFLSPAFGETSNFECTCLEVYSIG